MNKGQPKVGDRRRMICKQTGEMTLMEFTGESASDNGHPGWICLHGK